MPRRVNLPGAAELFRSKNPSGDATPAPSASGDPDASRERSRASGRVRHDDKITVYVSAEELVALEQGRLTLRRDHALAVDRGRIVRAAIAIAMDDLNESGAESDLVHRLQND